MSDNLRDRLLKQTRVATPDESARYFEDEDSRWGETLIGEDSPSGLDTIYINDRRFLDAGSNRYRDKAILGESLHLLKTVDPDRYARLQTAAQSSPEYMDWAKRSYDRSRGEGEERSFEDWHGVSRFDQVIGGYLFAGDEDLPTMRNWSRDKLPYGEALKQELELLRQDLELE